jgi:para-aminobenzoate synthetase component 1
MKEFELNMLLSKTEAISRINELGSKKNPFLFMVDFEMKAIRVIPLDKTFPQSILYHFPYMRNSEIATSNPGNFVFRKLPMSFEDYLPAYNIIQEEIQTGNTFLTNLTFPTSIDTTLSLREIFLQCSAKYKLFVENLFVCFSPETFVRIHNDVISTYPMKGTISSAVDDPGKKILTDTKEMAEHCTIVDLLRNDLSQVAYNVNVERFRYIDRIKTHEGELLQVSSEISGRLPEGYLDRLGEIIFSLLPAGSVTGAPKQKTLEIIKRAEKTDRGYYTGVCGIFDGNSLDSAVLIRFIENINGKLQFRSGGGITFLSEAMKEYQEFIDKVYVPITRDN